MVPLQPVEQARVTASVINEASGDHDRVELAARKLRRSARLDNDVLKRPDAAAVDRQRLDDVKQLGCLRCPDEVTCGGMEGAGRPCKIEQVASVEKQHRNALQLRLHGGS